MQASTYISPLSNLPAAFSRVFLLSGQLEGRTPPPYSNDLPASDRYGGGDLVECRVGDVVGFDLGCSLNYRGEYLGHLWISSAVVSLGILRLVPQTDREGFRAALSHERDF